MVDAGGVVRRGTRSVPTGVFHVPAARRRTAQFNQSHIRPAVGHQQRPARDAVVGRPGAARAGAALVVEVIGPRVGVAQAVVGREEIRRSVVGCVVDQRPGARGKSAVHDQRDRLLFNLPIRPFWTVHVDVAGAAVAKWACCALGRVKLGFPLEQGAVPLNHLGDGDLAWVVEPQGFPVFQNDLLAFHQDSRPGRPTPSRSSG